MELTVSIKEHSNIAAFLNVIKKLDYIEIVDVSGDIGDLPLEHRRLLEKRLKRIEKRYHDLFSFHGKLQSL